MVLKKNFESKLVLIVWKKKKTVRNIVVLVLQHTLKGNVIVVTATLKTKDLVDKLKLKMRADVLFLFARYLILFLLIFN